MAVAKKTTRVRAQRPIRRSVSLAPTIDRQIRTIAHREKRSSNQVLESLIAAGLAAKEEEKKRFFAAAERLQSSKDPQAVQAAKAELARMIFGE